MSHLQSSTTRPASTIPALSDCAGASSGPTSLVYDASLRRPLRLRDQHGTRLDAEAQATIRHTLAAIDAHLHPLAIAYLRAACVPAGGAAGHPLDGRRLACLPELLSAYAASWDKLHGVPLTLRPRLRVVDAAGGSGTIDTTFDVAVAAAHMSDAGVETAVRKIGAWAAKVWANATQSSLSPWLLDSGVRELRLHGCVTPDAKQTLEQAVARLGPSA